MSKDNEWPLSFHLVGLTAAVIFCFFAATFLAYGYAAWQEWQLDVSDPQHPHLLVVAILALTSAVTFVTLVRCSLHDGAAVAIAYLTLLLLLLCWSSASWWSTSGGWHHIFLTTSGVFDSILRILAFSWLTTLLLRMWSTIRSTPP
jgi:hypothetical protein